MPNYCYNRLTIKGPTAIEIAESLVSNESLDLNLIERDPLEPSSIHHDEWCISHWGTAGIYNETVTVTLLASDSVKIAFETPWNPPSIAVAKLALDFPENAYKLWFSTNENGGGTIYFTKNRCRQEIAEGDSFWREICPLGK